MSLLKEACFSLRNSLECSALERPGVELTAVCVSGSYSDSVVAAVAYLTDGMMTSSVPRATHATRALARAEPPCMS